MRIETRDGCAVDTFTSQWGVVLEFDGLRADAVRVLNTTSKDTVKVVIDLDAAAAQRLAAAVLFVNAEAAGS